MLYILRIPQVLALVPIIPLALGCLTTHARWWQAACALGGIFFYAVLARLTNVYCSRRSLKELEAEYLTTNHALHFQELDASPYLQRFDFPARQILTQLIRRPVTAIQNALPAGDNPLEQPFFNDKPFRVFKVIPPRGLHVLSAKAYSNLIGTSIVFVKDDPENLSGPQRFLLLHELAHVSLSGTMLIEMQVLRPVAACLGLLSLALAGLPPTTLLALCTANLVWHGTALFNSSGMIEAHANSLALQEVPQLERLPTAIWLEASFRDQLTVLRGEPRKDRLRIRKIQIQRNSLLADAKNGFSGLRGPGALFFGRPGLFFSAIMAVWYFAVGRSNDVSFWMMLPQAIVVIPYVLGFGLVAWLAYRWNSRIHTALMSRMTSRALPVTG